MSIKHPICNNIVHDNILGLIKSNSETHENVREYTNIYAMYIYC